MHTCGMRRWGRAFCSAGKTFSRPRRRAPLSIRESLERCRSKERTRPVPFISRARENLLEPGAAQTFDEAYDEIAENVKEAAAKKAYLAWIERLRAETYVKVF